MKKYILVLILSIFLFKSYGQAINDSLAIVQLLEKEAASWRSGDIKAHSDCWQVRPYNLMWVTPNDGNTMDIPPSMIINPSADISGKGGFAVLSNYKMSIYTDNAWVSHNEVSISKDGKETHSREIRLLEKIEDQWKLVGQSTNSYKPDLAKPDTTTFVHTIDVTTGQIETILSVNKHYEAPNWHPNNYLILNGYGKLYTLDLDTKELKLLNTGFANAINNDHGISPDNKWLAISHNDKK